MRIWNPTVGRFRKRLSSWDLVRKMADTDTRTEAQKRRDKTIVAVTRTNGDRVETTMVKQNAEVR